MSTVSVSSEVADLLRAGANVIPIDSVPNETGCTKSYVTGDSEPYNIGTGCACHRPEWHADDPSAGCDECQELHPILGSLPAPVWVALQQPCPTCNGAGERHRPILTPPYCYYCRANRRSNGRLWFTITTPCDGRCDRTSGAFKHSDECSGEWPVVEASIERIEQTDDGFVVVLNTRPTPTSKENL